MKRKIIRWIVVAVIAAVVAMLACFIHSAHLMRHLEIAQGGVYHLAPYIEAYKDENGRYPASLQELESKCEAAQKPFILEILHNYYHDEYTYDPSTNDFRISVRTGKSLFYKRYVGGMTFKPNEGLAQTDYNGSEVHLVPE